MTRSKRWVGSVACEEKNLNEYRISVRKLQYNNKEKYKFEDNIKMNL
jgi:hypothetical protein